MRNVRRRHSLDADISIHDKETIIFEKRVVRVRLRRLVNTTKLDSKKKILMHDMERLHAHTARATASRES
jgi:hypothetical protein